FFFSSRRRHTRFSRDWSSDVCSSDLERDLLRGRKSGADRDRPQWLEFLLGSEAWGDGAGPSRLLTVADVMTVDVTTIGEDTPVREIADMMQRHDIKRVPVVKDGKVNGIVSRADLLRGLARQ